MYICVGFVPPVVKNETVKGGLGDKGVCLFFCLLRDCFIYKPFRECQISCYWPYCRGLRVPPPLKWKCLDAGSHLTISLLDMQVRYKKKMFLGSDWRSYSCSAFSETITSKLAIRGEFFNTKVSGPELTAKSHFFLFISSFNPLTSHFCLTFNLVSIFFQAFLHIA